MTEGINAQEYRQFQMQAGSAQRDIDHNTRCFLVGDRRPEGLTDAVTSLIPDEEDELKKCFNVLLQELALSILHSFDKLVLFVLGLYHF